MNRARVLVVEDERIVAMDIQGQLENLDYDVVATAVSGEEAIHKAEETGPDLALMDIRIRGDMDGIEVAQHLRTKLDIPVIYLTAYADQDTLDRAKNTESFGYLLKPFEEGELHATIDQHPEMMGQFGVQYALDLVSGKAIPEEKLVPLDLVTEETVGPERAK